ncbi:alpha/beta hydrolase [Agromyces sp. G08B096]|uniref:Alpha/beta hydrolase n=1 Tax=Agromyces sp. G08B096 TaxID=3156399 RepID=A0AAU7W617_9MICO
MTETSLPVLFLSGAGLQPWIWDDVRASLPSTSAVAPRPTDPDASLSDHVAAALDAAPAERFAVVAHSIGGVVGLELARRAPDRVAAVLGLAAAVPAPGDSFVSAMPAPNRWLLAAMLRLAGTRPPESAIRRGVAAGIPEATADRLVAEFAPESSRLYLDRTGDGPFTAARGYLGTTRDPEFPAALQRRFAQRLGEHWSGELPSGHLPMLECPDRTSAAIQTFLDADRAGAGRPAA